MSAFDELARLIADLERRLEQQDRRINNTIREARVTKVDPDKALAKVEAHGLPSAWSPWLERAGKIRTWSPPAADERVLLISPTGEPGQGFILRGGFSDQFTQPSSNPDEDVLKVGDLTITWNKDKAVISMKDGGKAVVTKKMAKIRKGESWVVVTGDKVIVSHEPEVGPDPDNS